MRLLLAILIIAIVLLSIKILFRIFLLIFLNRNFFKNLISILLNKSNNGTRPSNKEQHKMVKCAKCQLYILENKAYYYQGKVYCCEEHAKS